MDIALFVVFMLNYRLNDLIEIWCRVIIYLVVLTDYLISIIFSMKCPSPQISVFPLCYISVQWKGGIVVGVVKIYNIDFGSHTIKLFFKSCME